MALMQLVAKTRQFLGFGMPFLDLVPLLVKHGNIG